MSSRLLIDGYNLLFASDVFASSSGPPTLERTRGALLQVIADALDARLRGRTVVVFDATQAPPGLPRELSFAGMQILFSRRGQEADDLLEDLLAAHRAPQQLLVVSSDHRVQRAARQRGAKHIDSGQWLRELRSAAPSKGKPAKRDESPADSAELQQWLAEFAEVDSRRLSPTEPFKAARSKPAPSSNRPAAPAERLNRHSDRPPDDQEKPISPWNPFPPGYAEDLLDDERK